eukprot:scaffold8793_cov133-Skeletonema_marinoi.AAC.1
MEEISVDASSIIVKKSEVESWLHRSSFITVSTLCNPGTPCHIVTCVSEPIMVHVCDDVRSDRLCENTRLIETADDVCSELMVRKLKRAAPSSGRVVLMGSFIV